MSGETLGLYRYIDTLPPGSVILMIADQSPAAAAECQPGMLALFQHAVNRGLRVMFFAARTDAVPFISDAFIKGLGEGVRTSRLWKEVCEPGIHPPV